MFTIHYIAYSQCCMHWTEIGYQQVFLLLGQPLGMNLHHAQFANAISELIEILEASLVCEKILIGAI